LTPDECKPGMVVQWATPAGIGVVLSVNAGAAAVHHIERPDGTKATPGTGHVACSELLPAARFLMGGEWVHYEDRGERIQGKIAFAQNGLGSFAWVAYPEPPAEPTVADNLVTMVGGRATTYFAAREAVERAVGFR
jgi:hypothetical protein